MNIICPIFPKCPSEADLLWKAYGKESYIDHVLRGLRSEENVWLNILTNHKELYKHLEDKGFNAFWVDVGGHPTSDSGLFAHFNLPRLEKQLGDMLLDGTEELVLLDIRYPLITHSVINEALAQYRRSNKAAVVSVSQPVDHPAQIETFFTYVGFDILSIIDEGFDIGRFVEDALSLYGLRYPASAFSGVCFSKPFPFNWESYRIQPHVYNSLIYRVYDEDHDLWPRPCPGVECMERFACQSPGKYYLFENSKQARRLYPSDHLENGLENNIKGLSFSNSFGTYRCLLSGGKGGKSTMICLHGEYIGNNYLMRIESTVASQGKDSCDAVLVDIDRHIAGTPALEAFGEKFQETDIRLDRLMPGDHWVVTILENVSCGTADLVQPIQLENASWYTDHRTLRKYDVATNKELAGRQFLPKVFRLDGALLIAERSYVLTNESVIDYNDIEGFVLEGPISKRIASEIDFLRLISL